MTKLAHALVTFGKTLGAGCPVTASMALRGPGGEPPTHGQAPVASTGLPEVEDLRAKIAGLGAELAGRTPASS